MDIYLYRHKARAPRGECVYDKVSGHRFERISVVAGQISSQIVAPLLYHGTMTEKLFTKWYQEQLLPSLTELHLIIMDNATFHPKKQLDELALAKGHYFLPLPPYSPEFSHFSKQSQSIQLRLDQRNKRESGRN